MKKLRTFFLPAILATTLMRPAGAQNSNRIAGTVIAWGFDGLGATTVPAKVTNVVAIAAGRLHSLALRSDGTIAEWGGGAPPDGLTGVVAVSAGFYHSLALKADGTVVAWGLSTSLPGLDSVVAIVAAGGGADGGGDVYGGHNLALRSNGTVVAWGLNDHGQCTVPGQLDGVVAIAGGETHSLALKSNGTVEVWGEIWKDNTYITPVAPEGLNGVVAIAAGRDHNLALKADATVVAWGGNDWGQCDIPAGLKGVVAISAGGFYSMALKADGTVVAWGNNDLGKSTVPAGLKGVIAIAAGGYHSLALVADAPALTVRASDGQLLLSWPLWAEGFALQATSNVADENSWTPIITAPDVEASYYQVTEPISDPTKCYRLKK